jgi:hypothetical protein
MMTNLGMSEKWKVPIKSTDFVLSPEGRSGSEGGDIDSSGYRFGSLVSERSISRSPLAIKPQAFEEALNRMTASFTLLSSLILKSIL